MLQKRERERKTQVEKKNSPPTHIHQCHCSSSAFRRALKCVKALINRTDNKMFKCWTVMWNPPRYLRFRMCKVAWNEVFFFTCKLKYKAELMCWVHTETRSDKKVVSRSKQQINKQLFQTALWCAAALNRNVVPSRLLPKCFSPSKY